MSISRSEESKNSLARTPPRNRYAHRSKLTEYKFLKALRNFADGKTPREAAGLVHISERSLRPLFATFRQKIVEATRLQPLAFGSLGLFLFNGAELRERGALFLEALRDHPVFALHLVESGARPRDSAIAAAKLFEVAARLFCTLSIRDTDMTQHQQSTQDLASKIEQAALGANEFAGTHYAEEIGERLSKIRLNMQRYTDIEQARHVVQQSISHRASEAVFYEDLRRFILKNPL